MNNVTGGDKLRAKLQEIQKAAQTASAVRIGFLENATYPDGQQVAAIAALQEWGGRIERDPSTVTVYRKVKADGSFAKNGRFVKRKQANHITEHAVGAYSITIPPRPFFRSMIKANSGTWGAKLGVALKQNKFDSAKALDRMGHEIGGELRQSIVDFTNPPNAPSTVAAKGFNKPLVDTGHMLNSIDSQVLTEMPDDATHR